MEAVKSTPSMATIARQEITECKKNSDYVRVLTQSQEIADTFKKTDAEGNQLKSPLATAVSVVGVVLSTFLLGKNIGNLSSKLGSKLATKIPVDLKSKAAKFISSVDDKVFNSLAGMKNTKLANKLFNFTELAKSGVSYAMKNPGNVAGAVAVAGIAPKIVKADGNGDGIADIAQNNISAYNSALKNAELLTEIASVLS